MLTTDITCADEFGRFLKITDDYSWEAINALYNFFEGLAETQEGNLCVTRDDVFFQWNEYDSIKDLNVDEFKSLEDLENAGYSVLRLDNGKFVTDYL
ncbi:TPA: hypothetical protein CPU00_00475 [Candidatus Gastranaerophilales bacterium HUM_18]|jgi:hypothetical protein|nr:MAG TPA: hypothetical protein CPU00_00475 [Candidatus Gastranaerophilales bacterium HUM_18]